MTPLTKCFGLLLLAGTLITAACSKSGSDPNGCGAAFNFAVELQAETNAVTSAASAYGNNPTTENCNAYKAAFEAYLDAAEDIRICISSAEQSAYEGAIAEARADLDALQC